jgi:hypothetical protein
MIARDWSFPERSGLRKAGPDCLGAAHELEHPLARNGLPLDVAQGLAFASIQALRFAAHSSVSTNGWSLQPGDPRMNAFDPRKGMLDRQPKRLRLSSGCGITKFFEICSQTGSGRVPAKPLPCLSARGPKIVAGEHV